MTKKKLLVYLTSFTGQFQQMNVNKGFDYLKMK